MMPSHIHNEQDAKAPRPSPDTFTLAPADSFSGVNLILGSETQKKMDSTFKDKCRDAGSPDCISAVSVYHSIELYKPQ